MESIYLFDSHQRLFWLYLLGMVAMVGVYSIMTKQSVRHYFSAAIWCSHSAKLDYHYFFVSWVIKSVIILPFILSAVSVMRYSTQLLEIWFGYQIPLLWDRSSIVVLYTVTLFLLNDLSRYVLHRWMHTVPWLWRFHAVHHRAHTLNPLTFYRVHPVENVLFGLRYAVVAGVTTGLFVYFFGARVGAWEIIGVNGLFFLSALLGANLRHTHIPIRFGSWLERVFISPYMHQLHHSKKGRSSNFGGVLSIWDALFGTRNIAEVSSIEFGLEGQEDYNSIVELLREPFLRK